MAENVRAHEDLAFVRSAVERADSPLPVRGVYLLWAVIVPVGFLLADVAPEFVALFWLVVGPLGGVASFMIGRREGRALGQESRSEARRHALHWIGMALATTLLVFLGLQLGPFADVAPLMLVVVALGWFLAGVYGDPAMMWLGGVMAVAALAAGLLGAWAWTISGLVLSAGLALAAFRPRRTARA